MTSRRDLAVASVDRYLTRNHSVLWGQAWDTSDDSRRRAAAEWFVDELLAWSGGEGDEDG